jgi:DNA-binding NtrC family response regulator
VLADLDMCDGRELELLESGRMNFPETPFVVMGGGESARRAAKAVRAGCDAFLVKPLDRQEVADLLAELLPNHQVPLAAADEQDGRCLYLIAGQSPQFLRTIALARKAAPTSVPVLITGESGTGKELVSYLVHRHSRRSARPYIRVNCAALSESLLESELFGHERGAFTGACSQRKGRFERAHGGTLLLDEVSETTPRLQAELLRVLEQQDFERVGGSESVRVNVRIISTSNCDLARRASDGRFRKDLYYRLCGVHLAVPPLRE